jgi:hypothetical protein
MKTLAWKPPGLPADLAGVLVPPGELTDHGWWMALSERVTRLVMAEPDPAAAARQAARALDAPGFEDPEEAGQFLVQRNLHLMTVLNLQVQAYNDPFPAKVLVESRKTRQEIEDVDLWIWVDLAAAELSPHSLD